MTTTATSGHSLHVQFDPTHARVTLSLNCHETGRVACRLTCSEGCESWNEHTHEHVLIPTDECNAVVWMGDNAEEYCSTISDKPFPLHDGMPIELDWEGDTYIWAPMSPQELEVSA